MLSVLWESLSNVVFLALHMMNTYSFPHPLPAEEEQRYLVASREQNDTAARNKLIEHNLRLVAHIIKKYYNNTSDQEDLISIGTIGLIKAVNTFDYTKGIRLATYVTLIYTHRRKKKMKKPLYTNGFKVFEKECILPMVAMINTLLKCKKR